MIEFLKDDALGLWMAGGWLMGPLFVLGLLIYFSVFQLYFQLRSRPSMDVDPNLWGHWVDSPEESKGELGRIIRFTQMAPITPESIALRFNEVKTTLLDMPNRRIRFVNIIVSAAPLTGLLGTVSGMLTTFGGISSGSGSSTVATIAGGISEALITTEAGLVLAIPAYVALSRIKRMIEDLEHILTKLETATLKRHLKATPTSPS
jgi:biopolymer transport protein ExbB